MTQIKGLAPAVSQVFEAISKLESIKPYTLCGGTALSIQLGTRLSEGLDFMSWRKSKSEKMEVDWPSIKKDLESVGTVTKCDILDSDHIEFVVENVKVSFYASPRYSPVKEAKQILNNIYVADLEALGAMKMELMLRRSKFRDYYDIFSLLEAGVDFKNMVYLSLKHSGHILRSKNLLSMLTNSDRFIPDASFEAMNPVYKVGLSQIEARIKAAIKQAEF